MGHRGLPGPQGERGPKGKSINQSTNQSIDQSIDQVIEKKSKADRSGNFYIFLIFRKAGPFPFKILAKYICMTVDSALLFFAPLALHFGTDNFLYYRIR